MQDSLNGSMYSVSSSELAQRLNLSKGRISQYVSEGKLDGCFSGDGRARRFDPDLVAKALSRGLDKGQMLGNGLTTRRAIRSMQAEDGAEPALPEQKPTAKRDGRLDDDDVDQMELVKIATANENLRRLRRDNELSDGNYVLASEVERAVARVVAQEVANFETVLREGARAIADQLGVDFKAARKILIDMNREHRKGRTRALEDQAEGAIHTEAEKAADI